LTSAGAVFDDRQTGLHRGEHGHPAGMTELERAPDVGGVEQTLDGDAIGTARFDEQRQAAMESPAACLERTRAQEW
jgi:hypothetical protein